MLVNLAHAIEHYSYPHKKTYGYPLNFQDTLWLYIPYCCFV